MISLPFFFFLLLCVLWHADPLLPKALPKVQQVPPALQTSEHL